MDATPHRGRGWFRAARTAARLGQAHWFFGNLYEAVVDVPRLLTQARDRREPTLLDPGSPVRYYGPAVPVTLGSTAAVLVESWRSGGDRRAIAAGAAGTASAVALSAYLVRNINVRLLRGRAPLTPQENRRMLTTWHALNLLRLLSLAAAVVALPRALPPGEEAPPRTPNG